MASEEMSRHERIHRQIELLDAYVSNRTSGSERWYLMNIMDALKEDVTAALTGQHAPHAVPGWPTPDMTPEDAEDVRTGGGW